MSTSDMFQSLGRLASFTRTFWRTPTGKALWRRRSFLQANQCGHAWFAEQGARIGRCAGERLSTLLSWRDEPFLAQRRGMGTWRARMAGKRRAAGALA